MKRTSLYDTHLALGARMVEFGGWEMPVQYTSILEEHHAVRQAAGLFDIDHMGQIEVQGPDAFPYMQHVVTNDVNKMEVSQAAYGLLCYADGGVVDDVFTYRLTSRFFVAVNASNVDKDYAWMLVQAAGYDVQITNRSEQSCMLAIQGPKAQEILQGLTPAKLSELRYHHCLVDTVGGIPTLIGRTGYTGEDGFELFFPVEHAYRVWVAIHEVGKSRGLKPCGLGARDSLRFEAKMPLYGHEIGPDINPIEAGLGWAVALNAVDKQHLLGRDALLKVKLEGPKRKLVGFEMIDRGIARNGYEIAVAGRVVGYVTTGMYSPTLGKNIGLGYVPAEYAGTGTDLEVIIRGRHLKAVVVPTPFYKRPVPAPAPQPEPVVAAEPAAEEPVVVVANDVTAPEMALPTPEGAQPAAPEPAAPAVTGQAPAESTEPAAGPLADAVSAPEASETTAGSVEPAPALVADQAPASDTTEPSAGLLADAASAPEASEIPAESLEPAPALVADQVSAPEAVESAEAAPGAVAEPAEGADPATPERKNAEGA